MRVRRLTAVLALAVGLVLLGIASPVWASDVDGDGVNDTFDVCNNTPPGTAVDAQGRPLGDMDRDCDTDLDDFVLFHQQGFTGLDEYALFQQGFTGSLAPPGVVIDTVPVGNPGNANDTHGDGYGGVDYVYQIGTFEVTAGQYTAFLNAVAATDTYRLFNWNMWLSGRGCKIEKTGSSPNLSYRVAPDWADRPVSNVTWGDAARFANWLHNGQPAGPQDLNTTEDGSYYLNGAMTYDLMAIKREPNATWVIPSENEWYKAAYYDGGSGVYYDYPTSSDSVPVCECCPGGANSANYNCNSPDGWACGPPYFRNNVGCYVLSGSPYGTFDQGGNVWEWNETIYARGYRGLRGGAIISDNDNLYAANRYDHDATAGAYFIGFRVAKVPDGVCGNGMTEFGEECDDGNAIDGDGCDSNCMTTACGNGIVTAGEDCDDWNLIDGDGCSSTCTIEPMVMETVPVGNPGNADDTHGDGYGGVDYVYNIGKFEVTAGQYTEFLNAVAATDTYDLYNPTMDGHSYGCQIRQNGTSGSYTYDFSGRPSGTEADWLDRPVNYVSWGDAARFANWLHNDQPMGAQDLSTTEDGSYLLDGAMSDAELLNIEREPNATWVIPSEDEWYKAAFYDGGSGVYYDYPTSSDSVPSNDLIDPDPGNNATFNDSGYTIGRPYYRTGVGAHKNSESPYGTFDQGGNVWEWNEAIISRSDRGLRGGGLASNDATLHAANRHDHSPAYESYFVGFRVAEVP